MASDPSSLTTLLDAARVIADDHDAGAAQLLSRLLPLLDAAVELGGDAPRDLARIVVSGQPAMAPLWHACAAAVADGRDPGTFARARAEMLRAPSALVRAASFALRDLLAGEEEPTLLTLSFSSTVAQALAEVAAGVRLRAICGEGRPRLEGRRLAANLAGHGVAATVVTDAALTAFLPGASAVVMGADAVLANSWINKVGSFGLAAAAALRGVPVYVVATRDKFTPAVLSDRIVLPKAPSREVWSEAPSGVAVENRYFETIPAELATLFLTDAGPLPPLDVRSAVERHAARVSLLLHELE